MGAKATKYDKLPEEEIPHCGPGEYRDCSAIAGPPSTEDIERLFADTTAYRPPETVISMTKEEYDLWLELSKTNKRVSS